MFYLLRQGLLNIYKKLSKTFPSERQDGQVLERRSPVWDGGGHFGQGRSQFAGKLRQGRQEIHEDFGDIWGSDLVPERPDGVVSRGRVPFKTWLDFN